MLEAFAADGESISIINKYFTKVVDDKTIHFDGKCEDPIDLEFKCDDATLAFLDTEDNLTIKQRQYFKSYTFSNLKTITSGSALRFYARNKTFIKKLLN